MKTYQSYYKNKNKESVIEYDREWEEYCVTLYINRGLQDKLTYTYYTNDLEDAISTAKLMVEDK